jgi:xylulokinase
VILSATDALNWYADLVGAKPADLTANLAELNAPGKTLFLPYLGGERTPINSASVRAAFLGLEHATDRDAATRAVLEGVTFALRACRDAIARTGTPVRRLIAVGGGSRSDYWLNAIATALQVPVMRTAAGDYGAAFGAARLGATAVTGSRDLLTQPEIARTFDPDVSLAGAFDQGFARYTQATTALLELT